MTAPRRCSPHESGPSLLHRPMDGEPTLEKFLAGVWEGLAVRGEAACPICGGPMEARYGAHASPIDGRCSTCGSALS